MNIVQIYTFLLFALFFLNPCRASAEPKFLNIPLDFKILGLPASSLGSGFKIEKNKFYVFKENKWEEVALPKLDGGLKEVKSARGDFIAGTPIIVLSDLKVDVSELFKNNSPLRACSVAGLGYVAREERVVVDREVQSLFTIFRTGKSHEYLGEFYLTSNPYNQYLSEVIAWNENQIALILKSSRHPYCNNIVLYDIKAKKPVGQREFSVINFLGGFNKISLADPVPNSSNMDDILKSNLSKKEVVMLDGKEVSRTFAHLSNLKFKDGK